MYAAAGAKRSPRKAHQTNRFERCNPQEPFQPSLRQMTVRTLDLSSSLVLPYPRQIGKVCEKVSQIDGDEGPCFGEDIETPLIVNGAESLQKDENDGV